MSKKSLFAIGMMLAAALALGGCQGSNNAEQKKADDKPAAAQQQEKKDEKKDDKKADSSQVALKDWEGTWNNFALYLDKPEVQDAYAEKAKEDNTTPDKVKSELKEERECKFGGMKISDKEIEFLDKFDADGGKVVAKSGYKFVKSHEVKHAGATLAWHLFEATSPDAPAKYLAMLPVHGEEELVHFHLRYGDDPEKLLDENSHWYPTMVKPNSTIDQIKDEVKE